MKIPSTKNAVLRQFYTDVIRMVNDETATREGDVDRYDMELFLDDIHDSLIADIAEKVDDAEMVRILADEWESLQPYEKKAFASSRRSDGMMDIGRIMLMDMLADFAAGIYRGKNEMDE